MNAFSRTGLTERDMALIVEAVRQVPEIDRVVLFGSRAKGTCKPGSDVDLAIKGPNLTYESPIRLSGILNEEIPLPFFFDVVSYHDITEPDLIAHIDRVGIVIFERT